MSTRISNVSIFTVAIRTENGLMLPDNKLITATPHRAARSSGHDWVTSFYITHHDLGQRCFDPNTAFHFVSAQSLWGLFRSSRITV